MNFWLISLNQILNFTNPETSLFLIGCSKFVCPNIIPINFLVYHAQHDPAHFLDNQPANE